MHGVSQRLNLRHLGEPLEGAKSNNSNSKFIKEMQQTSSEFFLKQRKVWLEEDCFDFILLICFDLSFVHSLIYSLIRLLNAMWDF